MNRMVIQTPSFLLASELKNERKELTSKLDEDKRRFRKDRSNLEQEVDELKAEVSHQPHELAQVMLHAD